MPLGAYFEDSTIELYTQIPKFQMRTVYHYYCSPIGGLRNNNFSVFDTWEDDIKGIKDADGGV